MTTELPQMRADLLWSVWLWDPGVAPSWKGGRECPAHATKQRVDGHGVFFPSTTSDQKAAFQFSVTHWRVQRFHLILTLCTWN